MKLTIKETLSNMIDELGRASEILKNITFADDNITELTDDIDNTLLNELELFNERIDLALLMSAAVGDIAIPTCAEIYNVEAQYELPVEDGFIDTETVYNTVEDATKNVLKTVYDDEDENAREDVENPEY